jgi:alkaline phosphatase D
MMAFTRRRGLALLGGAAIAGLLGNTSAAGSALAQGAGGRVGIAPSPPWLTLPADTVLERIAFGSCLDQRKPQPVWKAVLANRPQLFLMMGDNVYGDVKSPDLRELVTAYGVQAQHPELREARVAMPFLAIWDDHDYGRNDAGADFPYRDASARLFHEFWQMAPTAHPGGGVYYARMFGPEGRRVQIIMLDTRSFRSPLRPKPADFPYWGKYAPDPDPAKTMLGEAQWSWLETELQKPAEVRLLVSSIQVLAEGHGFERWGNLPRERDRLFDALTRTGARGVLILSGDRHIGAMYRSEGKAPYPLIEVTSSSLNMSYGPSKDARIPPLVSDIYHPENFGEISIDWRARSIGLVLRDVGGKLVTGMTVPLAELGYGR